MFGALKLRKEIKQFYREMEERSKNAPVTDRGNKEENGLRIILNRTDLRQMYDSEWKVVVMKDGETLFTTNIVRYDYETAAELDLSIRCFGPSVSKRDVDSLDMRSKIYYD